MIRKGIQRARIHGGIVAWKQWLSRVNTLVRTFKEFFYIFEDVEPKINITPFEGVSPSKLGFQNSILNLPDECPYGFWVDKHGNFIVVGGFQHNNVAESVFHKLKAILKRNPSDIPPHQSWVDYTWMMNNGCVRVQNSTGAKTMYYQTFNKEVVTSGHRKFLNFASELYDMPPKFESY